MRKAFTLVELLLSLVLTMLIVYFSYSFLNDAKAKGNWGFETDKKAMQHSFLFDTLKNDLMFSESYQIQGGKEYSILKLKTKNSLHVSGEPFVVWLVLKDKAELVRLESADEISLPVPESFIYKVYMDGFGVNCEVFKAYISSGSTDMMAFVKIKDEKPYIFEVPLKLNK